MAGNFLSISRVWRHQSIGKVEELLFKSGVNLLVGRPNTGKTKWLETLDYLLGDLGSNPFEGLENDELDKKYDKAGAELVINNEPISIERRWQESGAKSKVFVGSQVMSAQEFQRYLMSKLSIPLVHFPKGNPMSGQTWPELSFRMLLRHVHRRQRFWGDIVAQQPEGELHACVLQFLGVAEQIYSQDYGRLVDLKKKVEELKARKVQFGQTLDEIGQELVSEPGLSLGVNGQTIREATERVDREILLSRERRVALISGAVDKQLTQAARGQIQKLLETRSNTIAELEALGAKKVTVTERLQDIRQYHAVLKDEIERMQRVEDAGAVLADLKITHCPACDQPVSGVAVDAQHCFLCHQVLPSGSTGVENGTVRLQFERGRIEGEFKESSELLTRLQAEAVAVDEDVAMVEERLRTVENGLAPARQDVAALVQGEVSAIDMKLGELSERQRQLARIAAAVMLEEKLAEKIWTLEREIAPLQETVNERIRVADFDRAAELLESGMNGYLSALNAARRSVWRHSPVRVDLSKSGFAIRVGSRRWNVALGGTDSLYLMMAYQYGLLALSDKPGCHYPGIGIVDLPAEFAGEAVEDKENFIVQPFIDLLEKKEFDGGQLIITGASFSGLGGASRLDLKHVHVS